MLFVIADNRPWVWAIITFIQFSFVKIFLICELEEKESKDMAGHSTETANKKYDKEGEETVVDPREPSVRRKGETGNVINNGQWVENPLIIVLNFTTREIL